MYRALLLALLSTAAAGCIVGGGGHNSGGTITVDNASTHVITEIHIAAINDPTWGPNLLGGVLYPNDQLTVSVPCDTYDVMVTDDRARDCVLGNLDLCFSNQIWTIDNVTLRNCGF